MTEQIQFITEIVVNRCPGGFGLSDKARWMLADKVGVELVEEGGMLFVKGGYDRVEDTVRRDDPRLVAVVKELGKEANGDSADLRVETVVAAIDLSDNAGFEEVMVYRG